jgi:ribonuclease BN (tRNA processing enzyme)
MFNAPLSRMMLCLTLVSAPGLVLGVTPSACSGHQVELQVLGSGGPELDDGRVSSSYLVWVDGKARVLVDAGGGSSANFEKSGANMEDLQAVLFSHFHVDHSGDFAAYVKASFFGSRRENLPVFGPDGNDRMPSTSEFLASLLGKQGTFRYLSAYVEPGGGGDFVLVPHDVDLASSKPQIFELGENLRVSAIGVNHGPIAAVAWRVDIHQCAISFSGDMNNATGNLARLARGSQLLVAHNAIPEGAGGVARKLHMPPSEIGKIAWSAEIEKLIISHRMNRTLGETQTRATRAGIGKFYTGPIIFANDLDKFAITDIPATDAIKGGTP